MKARVLPFARRATNHRPVQSEMERRDTILGSAEAADQMQFARYLAEKTTLSVPQAIGTLAVSALSCRKAQTDALAAVVAKRRLKQRCIEILTSAAASKDIDLAVWLVQETDASAAVAIEVLSRTHESALSSGNDQND